MIPWFSIYIDIVVLGKTGEAKGKTGATNGCCGYGADGKKMKWPLYLTDLIYQMIRNLMFQDKILNLW